MASVDKYDVSSAVKLLASPVVWLHTYVHITKTFGTLLVHHVTKHSKLGCILTIISANTQARNHFSATYVMNALDTRLPCLVIAENMMDRDPTAVKYVEKPSESRPRSRPIRGCILVTNPTYATIVESHSHNGLALTTTRGPATTT